jgi:large subunit ribosomal protein L9
MKVILREEMMNLGTVGDVVKVAPGYARNFLLPRGKAVVADVKNVRAMEHEKRVAAVKLARIQEAAKGLAEKISGVALTFTARSGEDGKLFGSITNKQIAEQLAAKGFEVDRRKIVLAEPIKQLGNHTVEVKLGLNVTATVKVTVAADATSPAPVEAAAKAEAPAEEASAE